jgi:transposase-like protein
MSWFQKFIFRFLPADWAKAAEAESRTWMLVCPHCGHETSIWDAGGIRWGASGRSRTFYRCIACKKRGWQSVKRKAQ